LAGSPSLARPLHSLHRCPLYELDSPRIRSVLANSARTVYIAHILFFLLEISSPPAIRALPSQAYDLHRSSEARCFPRLLLRSRVCPTHRCADYIDTSGMHVSRPPPARRSSSTPSMRRASHPAKCSHSPCTCSALRAVAARAHILPRPPWRWHLQLGAWCPRHCTVTSHAERGGQSGLLEEGRCSGDERRASAATA
jgi:hypothetical protein